MNIHAIGLLPSSVCLVLFTMPPAFPSGTATWVRNPLGYENEWLRSGAIPRNQSLPGIGDIVSLEEIGHLSEKRPMV
jgi:hypothetical protein